MANTPRYDVNMEILGSAININPGATNVVEICGEQMMLARF